MSLKKTAKKRTLFLLFALLLIAVFSGCSDPDIPQGYAIIYGVADYTPWSDIFGDNASLSLTDDDARDMADMLEARDWDVRLRIDDGSETGTDIASIGRLEADIQELAGIMEEEDRFILYYSGHGGSISGYSDDNEPDGSIYGDEWIFLYADNPDWDNETLSDHTVNDDALGLLLEELPCRTKIVILDACNSGGFIGTGPGVDGLPPDYYTTNDFYIDDSPVAAFQAWLSFPDSDEADILTSQAVVIAAAGEDESSYEDSSLGHGVFTNYLLETPGKADSSNDGWVTVTEAYNYCLTQIDLKWNSSVSSENEFMPHLTGSPLDFVLYPAD